MGSATVLATGSETGSSAVLATVLATVLEMGLEMGSATVLATGSATAPPDRALGRSLLKNQRRSEVNRAHSADASATMGARRTTGDRQHA